MRNAERFAFTATDSKLVEASFQISCSIEIEVDYHDEI